MFNCTEKFYSLRIIRIIAKYFIWDKIGGTCRACRGSESWLRLKTGLHEVATLWGQATSKQAWIYHARSQTTIIHRSIKEFGAHHERRKGAILFCIRHEIKFVQQRILWRGNNQFWECISDLFTWCVKQSKNFPQHSTSLLRIIANKGQVRPNVIFSLETLYICQLACSMICTTFAKFDFRFRFFVPVKNYICFPL